MYQQLNPGHALPRVPSHASPPPLPLHPPSRLQRADDEPGTPEPIPEIVQVVTSTPTQANKAECKAVTKKAKGCHKVLIAQRNAAAVTAAAAAERGGSLSGGKHGAGGAAGEEDSRMKRQKRQNEIEEITGIGGAGGKGDEDGPFVMHRPS